MLFNPWELDATALLLWGIVAHLVADWILQNGWMALNKSKFGHPAGILHAGIHALLLSVVLGIVPGLVLGVIHYVIDLRTLLTRWKQIFKQTIEGPMAMHVSIWEDQVIHIVCIAIAALLLQL